MTSTLDNIKFLSFPILLYTILRILNHTIVNSAATLNKNLLYNLEKYYKYRKPGKVTEDNNYIHASVAVILNSELEILFIKRPEVSGDPYSGHVAFPGGKSNKEDIDPRFTAVREVSEEVGIDLEKEARIVSDMDQVKSLNPQGTGYIVTPFFAIMEEAKDLVVSSEVERCIWVSLFHLLDSCNMRVRVKERPGRNVKDFVYEYDNYIIWGMTGKIVNSFIEDVSIII